MLSSFKGALSKLKQTKIVQNISTNYNKLKSQIKKQFDITEIIPNLYHISYPEQQTFQSLKQHIGSSDYQIWNIGEYKYSKALEDKILEQTENGQIHHLCFQYYSNLPLYELIIAINSIHFFLELSKTHKVYIHCQDNKLRSSVFLACFVFKFKAMNVADISEAILFVNQKLQTTLEVEQQESQISNYKNEHIFFKNYVNYLNNPQIINQKKLQLLKIIISDAPKLKIAQDVIENQSHKELKVFVQIRSKQQIVLKTTYDSSVFQGDSICLELHKRHIMLGDDFLVMIKYIFQGKVYGMLRIQLNTNFIFEKFFRAHQQFIDLSSFCLVKKKSMMFVDFMFEEKLEKSDLAKLQDIPMEQALKLPKKVQQNQEIEKKEVQTEESEQKKAETFAAYFSLKDQEEEVSNQVDDEIEINRKIEEVMKNINSKQAQEEDQEEEEESKEQNEQKEKDEEKQKEEEKEREKEEVENEKNKEGLEKDEQSEDESEDLDDYLSKLEEQA